MTLYERLPMCRRFYFAIALLLIGCRPTPSEPTPTLYTIPDATYVYPLTAIPVPPDLHLTPTESVSAPQGPCDHPYLPLRDGASWQYHYTGADGAQSELTLQSHIVEGQLTVTFESDSAPLACIDGALIGIPAGMIGSGHPALGGAILAINPRGAFLPTPDVLSIAAPWDLEVDAGGSITLPLPDPTVVPILDGKIIISSFASAPQPLNTPAGSFLAIPIQQAIYYQITIKHPDGSPREILISATMRQFYVEQVGLVRAAFDGGSISSEDSSITATLPPNATLELTSYTLP